MTLSLAMIVRNEAHCLRRCLESVADLCDEMVVVDTGSTDDTVAIARDCGARVEYFEWNGSFADARNAALAYCSGDWILHLDADEAIDRGWHEGVRELMSAYPEVWCWALRIENLIEPHSLIHYISRLFRRLPGLAFEGRIHETVDRSGAKCGLESRVTNVTITHWGYQSEEVRKRKAVRNLEIHRADIDGGKPPPNTWYYLHRTYAQLGDMSAAAAYLDLALSNPEQLGTGQRAELLVRKYQCVLPQNSEVAERYLQLALKIAPNQIIGRIVQAQAAAKAGRLDEAREALDRALRVARGEVNSEVTGDVAVEPATIEKWLADFDSANPGVGAAAMAEQPLGGPDA